MSLQRYTRPRPAPLEARAKTSIKKHKPDSRLLTGPASNGVDNNDIYREEIMEHYRNPRNFGTMKRPTFEAEAVNPLCGDRILLQLKVNEKGIVEKVRFSGSGCAISTASSSLFTEWMLEKSVKKLKSVKPDQVKKLMRASIGPARMPCLLLSLHALQKMFSVAGENTKR